MLNVGFPIQLKYKTRMHDHYKSLIFNDRLHVYLMETIYLVIYAQNPHHVPRTSSFIIY